MRVFFLTCVLVLFVVPMSLMIGFGTLVNLILTFEEIGDNFNLKNLFFRMFGFGLGWLGVFNLWKLYYLLLRNKMVKSKRRTLLGLFCGVIIVFFMFYNMGSSKNVGVFDIGDIATIVFWSSPVVAAIIFSLMMFKGDIKRIASTQLTRQK